MLLFSLKDEKDGASKGFAPEDWFKPQVRAGSSKRSEDMLRTAGILPAGMFVVPGKGATGSVRQLKPRPHESNPIRFDGCRGSSGGQCKRNR